MAPKAAAPKKASKPKSTTSTHGTFQDMIKNAIVNLKERNGSSRQAIKKYIQANNNLGGMTDVRFNGSVNRAIAKGVEDGVFDQPKGASGPVKLLKAAPKAAAPKAEAKPKAAATKATTTTKKAPAKKTATATKSATTKKTTATKANASKPRAKKAATTSGPAVEEKPVVLGKTKSGRVTKSTAPPAKTTKKAAPKKAAATKKAAAPKKATPKKTEAAA